MCKYCLYDIPCLRNPTFQTNLLSRVRSNALFPFIEFNGLYVAGKYEWPFTHLIPTLKFQRQLYCANALVLLFQKQHKNKLLYLKQYARQKEVAILPVPLSGTRYLLRHFNQAQEIALLVAKHTELPIIHPIIRSKSTRAQSRLSKISRSHNVLGAFRLTEPIKYRRLIIVDDVITTASTINEICRTIRRRYPTIHIDVFCMAIALPPNKQI